MIIVDEEYSPSYKSEKHPYYSAQSVAIMRAKLESCLYIGGSTIPSIEAFYNTENEKSTLIKVTSAQSGSGVAR